MEAVPLSPVSTIDFSSSFLPTELTSNVTLNSSSIDKEETSPSTEQIITVPVSPIRFKDKKWTNEKRKKHLSKIDSVEIGNAKVNFLGLIREGVQIYSITPSNRKRFLTRFQYYRFLMNIDYD